MFTTFGMTQQGNRAQIYRPRRGALSRRCSTCSPSKECLRFEQEALTKSVYASLPGSSIGKKVAWDSNPRFARLALGTKSDFWRLALSNRKHRFNHSATEIGRLAVRILVDER